MDEEHKEHILLEGDPELQRAVLAIQEEYDLASLDQAAEFLLRSRMNEGTKQMTGAPPALYLVKPKGGIR